MADDINDSDTIHINWDLDNSSIESYSITTATGAQGSNYSFDSNTITTGTGGYFYNNLVSNGPSIIENSHNTLMVKGKAEFDGEVTVQGRGLTEFMESVEQRLNILRPNPELEKEWDQLRELGKQYRELERQLTEKSQMWKTLKR
jgi:hypothetical protein